MAKEDLPVMGGGRDYPPPLPDRAPYFVTYDGPEDPTNPHNFSLIKKVLINAAVGMNGFALVSGSAIFSAAVPEVSHQYHVGTTVTTLGTSLFVFGFASGPLLWGPLTELFGRKPILLLSSFGLVCFSFAASSAENIQTLLITRFFSGFSGASPMVVAPAAITDLYGPRTRGLAMALFCMIIFGGPMLTPIFGAYTTRNHHLSWRWVQYITGILASLAFLGNIFILEETSHPVILAKRAEILRRRTGNWGIVAPQELVSLKLKDVLEVNFRRPLIMLFTEPILFLVSLYTSFIYGLLYLFLTALPLIFQGNYKFKQGNAELPYIAMFIGNMLGAVVTIYFEKRYLKKMDENGGKAIPEEKLPAMMVGSVLFSIGLFWLGWAGSYPDKVHWIVPTLAAVPLGMGFLSIFLPCLNYLIDCYLQYFPSAFAGNSFMRAGFAAAFPLFSRQMFVNMKIQWAATFLGCFAAALVPVPFLFYRYGRMIREKSRYRN